MRSFEFLAARGAPAGERVSMEEPQQAKKARGTSMEINAVSTAAAGVLPSFRKTACLICGSVKKVSQCNRAKWPTVPAPPPFLESSDLRKHAADVRAEKAAREAAPRVPVCVTQEWKCCKCGNGCHLCCRWECDACAKDEETARRFVSYHNEVDPDVSEDEYSRRGDPPFSDLKLASCVTCRKSVCHSCSTSCDTCDQAVCKRCRLRHTWCYMCRGTIENNDDFDIGPVDREEGVCGACWALGGTRCGCGRRAYDSDLGSDEQEDSDDDDFDGSEEEEQEEEEQEQGQQEQEHGQEEQQGQEQEQQEQQLDNKE